MIIEPGTGGSITATTIEKYTFALIAWGHNIEASNTKNPNQVNYLMSNRDDETGFVSGNITIPCNIVMQSDGSSKYNYPNPYSASTGFVPGTGSSIKGQNYIEVLVNSFLFQILAELDPEKNTTGNRYMTGFDHTLNTTTGTLSTSNATLRIGFNIPTIATPGPNGVTITAMNYLQD